MKKIILVVFLVLILLLVGCDTGLEIVDIEVAEYPNNIVYFSGSVSELDLTGGVIRLQTKNGDDHLEDMDNRFNSIVHSIDFDLPGVYVVEVVRGEKNCHFPVQIIEQKE